MRLGARAIAPRRRALASLRQASGDAPVGGPQAVLRLLVLGRLEILGDGALLHHGGGISDQERHVLGGEVPRLDAPDGGDESRPLGFGEPRRRLEALASRLERRWRRRICAA